MNSCKKKTMYSISCVKRNMYQLDLGYKTIDFTFCQLLSFRMKILAKTTNKSLEDLLERDNFLLLLVADNKHVIYLDVPQLIKLRKVMLNMFQKQTICV